MKQRAAPQEITIEGRRATLMAQSKNGDVPVVFDADKISCVTGIRWYVLTGESVIATHPPQTILWRSLLDCQDRSKSVERINGNRLDFRVSNLRIVDRFKKAPRFFLPVEDFTIGPFDTEEAAISARNTLLARLANG